MPRKKKIRPRRDWTKEEEGYLLDNIGTISLKTIAKNLNRSMYSVKNKAAKLGVGDTAANYEGITLCQLAKFLGLHYGIVNAWIEKYNLPITKKIFVKEAKYKVLKIDDFWKWAEKHKQLLNFHRLEPLILGAEPDWVATKRSADKMNHEKKMKKRPWTKEETNSLLGLTKAGSYTYPEIAHRLQRTEAAVKRKLYDLGIKQRPYSSGRKIRWTEEETRTLVSMYEKGYGFNTIGEKVGRSAISVRTRLENLGYKFAHGILVKDENFQEKFPDRRYWTKEEERLLRILYFKREYKLEKAAKLMNRSPRSILHRLEVFKEHQKSVIRKVKKTNKTMR